MSVSVCTVYLQYMKDYLDVFLHSVRRNLKEVKEVIVVEVDTEAETEGLISEGEEDGLFVRRYSYPVGGGLEPIARNWSLMVCGHALGLHKGIELATGDYVMLSDPDIFFFSPVDEIYKDLIRKFDLNIVGISHFWPQEQCYLDFPCVTNCMFRRDRMPGPDWRSDQMCLRSYMRWEEQPISLGPLPGKYLIPGPIPEAYDRFPNPAGMYDCGCNLWLWNDDMQGRWLSFQFPEGASFTKSCYGFDKIEYPMNYSLNRFKANFTPNRNLGSGDLLFHRTRGTKTPGPDFKALYESVIQERI